MVTVQEEIDRVDQILSLAAQKHDSRFNNVASIFGQSKEASWLTVLRSVVALEESVHQTIPRVFCSCDPMCESVLNVLNNNQRAICLSGISGRDGIGLVQTAFVVVQKSFKCVQCSVFTTLKNFGEERLTSSNEFQGKCTKAFIRLHLRWNGNTVIVIVFDFDDTLTNIASLLQNVILHTLDQSGGAFQIHITRCIADSNLILTKHNLLL